MNDRGFESCFKYVRDTTHRDGRERGLDSYEAYLGFKREELEGNDILDLGSGETEKFSRDLKAAGVSAKVVCVNPDYNDPEYVERVKAMPDWQGNSVAATAEHLPFKDESFDKVFSLFAATVFAGNEFDPLQRENIRAWISEAVRVLKPGGEAKFAPVGGPGLDTHMRLSIGIYGDLQQEFMRRGFQFIIEPVYNEDFGFNQRTEVVLDETGHVKLDEVGHVQEKVVDENIGDEVHCSRIVIRKPTKQNIRLTLQKML